MARIPDPGPKERHVEQQSSSAELDQIEEPAHLIRVSTMVRQLLDEARELPLDERARERLRVIHSRAVEEIGRAVGPELRDELARLRPDVPGDRPPTQAELRIMHGQLVGWLEGVFHGVQAGLATRRAKAREKELDHPGHAPPG
ncbi:DUF2587 domain-containing protein [Nonomuraea sp. K274]|uniref:Bacterial proteasome activator n=1 Tax=Nonomuraea cypriaca TaxID=1187855 RepID=A0A931A5X7_9ACTN|nr:proteasome activator [Nonomuraea cypriaca]MBF8185728.1 DUF2587 domain-containing protein [Nonomuraea cypriaca]